MEKRALRPDCLMFMCEAKGECAFPNNCDERGFITRRQNRTPEEQQKFEEESLRKIGEK